MKIEQKILERMPLTIHGIMEHLGESVAEWTEAEKAQAREALWRGYLKSVRCEGMIQ